MLQKIIKVGNSFAMTIPKSFMVKTGFKAGDELFLHQEPRSKSILITTKEQATKMRLSPDLFSWLHDMEQKYSAAIKDLAKK